MENTIIESYIKLCIEHEIVLNEANHKKTNKLHKEITKIYKKLKKEENLNLLMPLLTHKNTNVKLWAALNTYNLHPTDSMRVLKEISNENTLIGNTTELVVKGIENGTIILD